MNYLVTKESDVLDKILSNIYGEILGLNEQVLEINPRLAEYGALLPQGVRIYLPVVSEEAGSKVLSNTNEVISKRNNVSINLWD